MTKSPWNSPPNWPTPPAGWTPPPGWQPDPAWGPAPNGWNFGQDAQGGADMAQRRKTNGRTLKIVGGVVGALVLLGIGASLGGGSDTAATASSSPSPTVDPAAAAAEARRLAANEAAAKAKAEEEAMPPEPEDFSIAIVVLEQQCFGSAGCNVTYRIDPSYNGSREVNDIEVTYEVIGGEDAAINTFTIDGEGTASFPEEEFASTPSSRTKLTAKATAVRKAS